MYNYQKFLQHSRQSTEQSKKLKAQQYYQQTKAQRQKEMVKNYETRVQHSVLRLMEEPVKVNIFKNPHYHPRVEDRTKRIVPNEMHFNYEQQSSRIVHTIHKNSNLDLTPFQNPIINDFRPSPNKSKTSLLKHVLMNEGPIKSGQPKDILQKEASIKKKQKEENTVIQDGQELTIYFRGRHQKTYFHTLESVVNHSDSLKIFMKQNEKNAKKSMRSSFDEQNPFELVKHLGSNNEAAIIDNTKRDVQKVERYKAVLQKCGLIANISSIPRGKKQKTQVIR